MRHVFGFDGTHYGWRPLMSPEGGGGGGDEAAAAAAAAAAAEAKAAADAEAARVKAAEKKPVTFEDEAALMARMARHTKTEKDKEAKALGYESHEAMVEDAKAAKAAKDAAKTEAEKEKERAAKAEAKNAETETKAKNALLTAAVTREGTLLGFVNPSEGLALMSRDGVKIDLDTATVTGVKEALTALLKTSPHLKGKGDLPGSGGGDFQQERKAGEGGGLAGALGRHYKGTQT